MTHETFFARGGALISAKLRFGIQLKVNTEKNGKSGKGSRASNTKHSAASMNRRGSVESKDSRTTTSMTKIATPEDIVGDESSDDEEIELYFKV